MKSGRRSLFCVFIIGVTCFTWLRQLHAHFNTFRQEVAQFILADTASRGQDEFDWSSHIPSAQQYTQLINTSGLDSEKAYRQLSDMVQKGHLDYAIVGAYPLPTTWFSPLDLSLLKEPAPEALQSVANITTSTLHIMKAAPLRVGDKFTVRVDLRDALGRPVPRGGHEVRVWMLSTPEGFDKARSKAAAGHVSDLGNGSYVASLPVLWPGQTTVVASLMRPREFRGVMLRLLCKMKSLFQIVAEYQREGQQEVTFCLAAPVVAGFPKTCNMTLANGGLPWYCGQPANPHLSCSDWVRTRSTEFPEIFPVFKTEQRLFEMYFRSGAKYRLHHSQQVTAEDGRMSLPTTPCYDMKPWDTWHQQAPLGFWDQSTWVPLKCSLPLHLTSTWIDTCLRDTTVLLLSDSNSRLLQAELALVWKCNCITTGNSGHDPIHCRKAALNTTVSWLTHAYPFFTRTSWVDRSRQISPRRHMDDIPSRGKYIVLIHLYAHFLVVHTYTFGLVVRDTANGVRALLSRNPQARVFVRGPHAMVGTEKRVIGDQHAERTFRILRQEFRDLMDSVVFLDAWDMTVANENVDIHPQRYTNNAILRLFLGHACAP